MAATTMHMALGMAVGSAIALPGICSKCRKDAPLADAFMRGIILSYGLGLYAAFPAFLGRLGVPGVICDGWWMNVFLGYPLLDTLKQGGMKMGAFLAGSIFCVQYTALLLAIRRSDRKTRANRPHPEHLRSG